MVIKCVFSTLSPNVEDFLSNIIFFIILEATLILLYSELYPRLLLSRKDWKVKKMDVSNLFSLFKEESIKIKEIYLVSPIAVKVVRLSKSTIFTRKEIITRKMNACATGLLKKYIFITEDALSGLDIEIVAPGHGIIWRTYLPKILEAYQKWATNTAENRAVIIYDTMWGSTEKMAYSLRAGLEKAGIPVTMRNLKTLHISDIMADVLRSKAILVGSPTLNNGIFPPVGAFLTYLKGLRPKNRIGFAFGSYGWGGQAVKEMETIMKDLEWDMPVEGVKIQYIPDEGELDKVKEAGKELGEVIKKE